MRGIVRVWTGSRWGRNPNPPIPTLGIAAAGNLEVSGTARLVVAGDPTPPSGWPDATNTGITGVGLTTTDLANTAVVRTSARWEGGTVTSNTATQSNGQVFYRVYFNGCNIDVNHDDVEFRECYIKGPSGSTASYMIDTRDQTADGSRARFYDCTILGTPVAGSPSHQGLLGTGQYELYRCDIGPGGNDCLKAHHRVYAEYTYLHDPHRNFDGAHSDCVQSNGTGTLSEAGEVYFYRCSINGPYLQTNAAWQCNATSYLKAIARECRFSGGNYTIRFGGTYMQSGSGLFDNVIDQDSYTLGWKQTVAGGTYTISGNTLEDGTPVG